MLIHALVISRLDYCNVLYVGLPMSLLWKLQQVQNMADKLLNGVNKHHHFIPILAAIHWLPVHFLTSFKVIVLTYKALNSLGPQHVAECLLPTESAHPTASQSDWLRMLTLRKAQKEKMRNLAFSAVAPRLWNELPPCNLFGPFAGNLKKVIKIMHKQTNK